MNKIEKIIQIIITVLIGVVIMIILITVMETVAADAIRRDNSRNPIIVFPPDDSTPISQPIYM